MARTVASASSLVLLAAGACSNAGLEPVPQDELGTFDNILEVEGQYCTDPEIQVAFPVKVLLVVDRSGSWQFTDPNQDHFRAIQQVLDATMGAPNVEVGAVVFNGVAEVLPFTTVRGDIEAFVDPNRVFPDSVTDYQGGLARTLQMLEMDMLDSDIAERARSKYVVMFISDGLPLPKCHAGCDNDLSCYAFCDVDPDADEEDDIDPDLLDRDGDGRNDVLIDLVLCGDYNADWQILQRVDQIVRLRETYAVGELRFHTLFVWSSALDNPGVLCSGEPEFDKPTAEALMTEMADRGEGTMREYDAALNNAIDFLHIDYTPIQRPFTLSSFIVYNASAVTTDEGEGFLPDSDRDGIGDDEEFDLLGNQGPIDPRLTADTDGDGYGDFLELQNLASGFDPLDPGAPALACPVDRMRDSDGDLLADCEEDYLGTSWREFDSDADRMPDGMEYRLGLDPTRPDAELDLDLDTVPNRDELVIGSNPALPDSDRARDLGYRYRVEDALEGASGEQCHGFDVNGLKLAVTLAPEGMPSSRGLNFVWIYAIDAPEDLPNDVGVPKAACVQARYLGESLKDPPGGRLVLTPENFRDPASITPADCVGYVP
ncbi:MAG: VWA domain-containing protein [Deltaproteobacteria bacterium]|nr:VWA domain-containing protein [Deltaproteobacteria bacterium]